MKNQLLWRIIFFSLVIFSSALTNFFASDDWFHLRVAQIENFSEFLNFFSFRPNSQSISFYRPITQLFFWLFQILFGLNPLPYYIFIFILSGIGFYLVFCFSQKYLKNRIQALLVTFFYSLSLTGFTRLYFISAFQESFLLVFFLATLLFWLKKQKRLSFFFFILALCSKESAVILPLVIFILDWSRNKLNLRKLWPFFLALVIYLSLRLFVFGINTHDSYLWIFSPTKALNTFGWYGVWALGGPEFLVDYVGSGLQILPKFYTDFRTWSYFTLGLILLTGLNLLGLFLKKTKKTNRKLIFSVSLFIIGILPVLFLPWHKFSLELTLSMVGFSLFLSQLINFKNPLSFTFLGLFMLLNLGMNYLVYPRHYSVMRATLSRRVFNWLVINYPVYPQGKYFIFENDSISGGQEWGLSRQIAHAVGNSEMFKVIYKDKNIKVYYRDFSEALPSDDQLIRISSKMFLE